MTEPAIPVLIVTGTIGAGKSTVAARASEILHDKGIRHALIEVDSLGEVYPPPDPTSPYGNDLAMKILQKIWPLYLETGITRAIVTMTLETNQELANLLAAMDNPDVTVVRLTASQTIRETRIRQREFGHLLDAFLEKTEPLAQQMVELGIGDIEIANDNRHPTEVAQEILRKLGWV